MDAYMEGQDGGQEDPCLPSQSVEPPLGQGSSRQKFEQWSFQSEPTEQRVQDFVQEAHRRASHQDTSDAISGHSSKPKEVAIVDWGLSENACSGTGINQSVDLCGQSKKS